MVVVPVLNPFATPKNTLATLGDEEDQYAISVIFCVLPFEKMPVAVNFCVSPTAMVAVVGVTSIDTNVAAVTVRVVFPDTEPRVAVIVVLPVLNPVANPSEPAAFEMAATLGDEESQVTLVVISLVDPSE